MCKIFAGERPAGIGVYDSGGDDEVGGDTGGVAFEAVFKADEGENRGGKDDAGGVGVAGFG